MIDDPLVLDADALAALDAPLPVPALLTPHAGELARMLDVDRTEVEADQLGHARKAADRVRAGCPEFAAWWAAHPDTDVPVVPDPEWEAGE